MILQSHLLDDTHAIVDENPANVSSFQNSKAPNPPRQVLKTAPSQAGCFLGSRKPFGFKVELCA